MDSRERRERSRRRLVVECRLRSGARPRVVPREDKRAPAADGVARRLEVRLLGEQELERAVVAGPRRRYVEAEDGRDVVGREDAVVLCPERLVGLRRADLRDVVRELELALGQVPRTAVALIGCPIIAAEGAFGDEFARGGQRCCGEEGERGKCLESHFGLEARPSLGLDEKQVRKCNDGRGKDGRSISLWGFQRWAIDLLQSKRTRDGVMLSHAVLLGNAS